MNLYPKDFNSAHALC